MKILIHYSPANPPLRRQDYDLWSDDDSREHKAQNPIRVSQVCPQPPFRHVIHGICICYGHVNVVGVGHWHRMQERG